MPERIGAYTVLTASAPRIIAWAAAVGKKEGDGPLGAEFDFIAQDTTMGQPSWEKAESLFQKTAVRLALGKAKLAPTDIDVMFACLTSASARLSVCATSECRSSVCSARARRWLCRS